VPSSDIISIPNFVKKSSKVKSVDGRTNMTTAKCSYLLWKEQATWNTVKVVPVNTIKGHGETEVCLYSFLTSALDGDEWSLHAILSIYPRNSLNRRLARAGLLTLDKRKVPMCQGVTKPTFQLKNLAILLILH